MLNRLLNRAWLRVLAIYAAYHRRQHDWLQLRKIDVLKSLTAAASELSDNEADLLGQMVELPHWQVFLKYQELERRDAYNNNLIHADNPLDIGYVKGEIGRMNKTEADLNYFMTQMQLRRREKEVVAKPDDVAPEPVEEQDEVDFDLA